MGSANLSGGWLVKVSDLYVAGIGTAETGRVDTAEAVRLGWWDAQERERSGLLSVTVAGTTPAPDLAVEAARLALAQSGHPPEAFAGVFHTNVHPQGPDGWSAQHYINRHTICQPVTSVEIHNGCVGFFSALHLAACYLTAAPGRTAALITAADNFGTPAVNRWQASKLFVLADGGGAIVLSRHHGFAALLATGAASDPQLEERHRAGEDLFPPGLTTGAMLNFEERTECFRQLVVAGARPLGDFGSLLADTAERTLKEAGVSMGEITKVIHDGFARDALRIIFLDALDVTEEQGIWEFTRRAGHAGPLDAIRGLEYAWKNHQVGPGDKVMLLSGAPGMEAACAILEITSAP
jgi:3-oxoacyl-[acyl-carrier-protein] synthase-3